MSFINGDNKEKEEKEGGRGREEKTISCGDSGGGFELPISPGALRGGTHKKWVKDGMSENRPPPAPPWSAREAFPLGTTNRLRAVELWFEL